MTGSGSLGERRRFVWSLAVVVALVSLTPAAAEAMGGFCTAPTVQPAILNPNAGINGDGSVNLGGGTLTTVECDATACTGYNVGQLAVSFDGGATWTSMTVAAAPAVSGTSAWSAPVPDAYPATAIVQCRATEAERAYSATSSLTVNLQVPPASAPPAVDSLTASPNRVFVGGTIQLTAVASDPDGDPLAYAWSATSGTVVASASGDTATWTATGAGDVTITVTVTDPSAQSASASVAASGVWADGYASMSVARAGFRPERIALDALGNAYVTSASAGTIDLFTVKGEPFRTIAVGGYPSGVAVAPGGEIYVSDLTAGSVRVLDPVGRPVRMLGQGAGELNAPADIALDPTSRRVFVAEVGAGRVRVFDAAGNSAGSLDLAPLMTDCTQSDGTPVACPSGNPSGVAVDPAGVVYVADSRYGTVRVYDALGSAAGTIGTFDLDLVRPGGLSCGPDGNLYVVDSYAGRLAVFAPQSRALLAFVGTFGAGPGQLDAPLDVAADSLGRLAVTNSHNARIEIYALPTFAGVACAGDSDCDGMPDTWELAHGLDPLSPIDAWLDADGDGLLDLEEYRHGTDPRVADTDHDGVSDGDEVFAGGDPLDARDHLPVAVAGSTLVTAPTRVTLDGLGSHDPDADALVYDWRQAGGPSVTLHGADTATPWLVARAAGDYRFVLRVFDGKVWSADADVIVTVLDVPPTADAGPDVGGAPGAAVTLDGRFSSEPNGETLTFAWTQVAGPAVALSGASTARPSFTPAQTGIYAFELVVSDAAHPSAAARVHVIVDAPGDHVPVAMAPTALDPAPVFGAVGTTVSLDGRGSADADGDPLTYAWTQVDGSPATLLAAGQAVASFVPAGPGVYRFELVVNDGGHASLPEVVTAVVSGASAPPLAAAGYEVRVAVLDPVVLGCDAGAGVTCTFTEVEGVQVPLRTAPGQTTFTPIEPGTYVFERLVADAAGPGTRDRITVIADAAGRSVPAARIAALSGAAEQGTPVTLDGSASSDADAATVLGYAWRQVRGPRACVDDPHAAQPQVTPVKPGYYVFELRVDDGALRSAPARVAFVVNGPTPPPVALAGDDLLVVPGATAAIDGSGSTGATAWQWLQVGGPLGAVVSGWDGAVLSVTPGSSGYTLRFRLSVTNGTDFAVPDDVYVSVVDVPLALERVDAGGGTVVVAKPGQALDGLRVEVPAGAFGGPVQLALGEVTRAWYAAEGREGVHGAILVGPVGEPLAKPISVRAPLGALRSGVAAANVQVVTFDEASGVWKQVEGVQADLSAGTVTFPVASLGAYQVTIPAGAKAETASGCGCGVGSGGGSAGSLVILAVGALLAFPRRRTGSRGSRERTGEGIHRRTARGAVKAGTILAAVALALMAPRARAMDAPHDTTKIPGSCKDCHLLHNSVGGGLTNTAGNSNLCLSCHGFQTNAVLLGWNPAVAPAGNQAVPGTGGSSHRWDVTAVAGKFGATGLASGSRVDPSGNLMCSSCHDQHTQANRPFDIRSPGTGPGRHFVAAANGSAQICTKCHAQWNYTSVGSSTYLCATGTDPNCKPAGGTAKITGTTVTGTGTLFKTGTTPVQVGWRIKCAGDPPSAFAPVQAVVSDTGLTLGVTYAGSACSTTAGLWEAAPTLSHPTNMPVTGANFKAAPYDARFYGVAFTTSGSGTVTLDGTKWVWATNALSASVAPRSVRFTSGTLKDLVCSISGNSTAAGVTTINLGTSCASVTPAANTTFEIGRVVQAAYGSVTTAGTTLTFTDSAKAGWPSTATAVTGLTLTVVAASTATKANVGKTVSITGFSAGAFTVGSGLTAAPAVGDVYRINWPANDTGTTSSGTTTSIITDASKSFPSTNILNNLSVRLTTHGLPNAAEGAVATYFGQSRTITANGTSTISLSSAVTGLVTTGNDTYELGMPQPAAIRGMAASPGTGSLSGTFPAANTLVGLSIRFLGGDNQGVLGANNQGMISVITANTTSSVSYVAVPAFTVASTSYEIDQDGNLTNNLALAGTLATSFTAGNVVCLSCHGAHFTDSASNTYDAAVPSTPGAGDGKLLLRDNDDRFCTSCHAVKIHSALTTTGTYGTWGVNFTCFTCHVKAHETTNLYLVKQVITTPSSGDKNVDFRFATKNGAWGVTTGVACGTSPNPACGPCEVCHTKTVGLGGITRWRNTGNADSGHSGGCNGCHKHEAGFSKPSSGSGESGGTKNCSPCHSGNWANMSGGNAVVSKHAIGNVADTNDNYDDSVLNPSWSGVTYLTDIPPASRSCTSMCHGDHPHDLGGAATHENNAYQDGATTTSRNNGSAGNTSTFRAKTDFDASQTNGGMCVSCHLKPVSATKPAIPKATYTASAHNFSGTAFGTTTPWSYKLHDGGLFARNCTKCHADRGDTNPQSAVTFGAVHSTAFPQLLRGNTNPGKAGYSITTFICYDCHGNGTTGTNLSGKPVATAAVKAFNHPVASDQTHDSAAEASGALGTRHVNCLDCHDPHAAKPAGSSGTITAFTAQVAASFTPALVTDSSKTWTAGQFIGYQLRVTNGTSLGATGVVVGSAGTNQLKVWFTGATAPTVTAGTTTYLLLANGTANGNAITPSMTNAVGVVPTFPVAPTPPAWIEITAPTNATDITTQYAAVTNYTVTNTPTQQAQVCLRCHSSFAFGTTPPNTLSGIGTSTGAAWSNTVGTAMPETDLAMQFNPNNLAHHAVFARGKNQPVRATFGNADPNRKSVCNPKWPEYTGGSISISAGTATLSVGLPVTALPGWYIYIGATSWGTATSGIAGGTSTGFLEITSIQTPTQFTVRAEGATDGTWNTSITVASTTSWYATAGLGTNFVPPWGPWSTLQCSDCHGSEAAADPLGPHGSANKWLLKNYSPPTFLFYGGTAAAKTTTVATVAPGAGDVNHFCLNCHRRDVYGDYGLSLSGVLNSLYGRQPHPCDTASGQALGTRSKWGIVCMNCHGGARAGTIHGTNLGYGKGSASSGGLVGGSYSGKRLLAGAYWIAVTRSTVAQKGTCWLKGAQDSVSNCSNRTGDGVPAGWNTTAQYDWDAGPGVP